MKTTRQTVNFKASPQAVYEMLMDSKKHSKFTESKAVINRKVGGKISAYNGYIDGKNIKLIPNKKIIQKWWCSDWPKGHYSIATFELKKTTNGTQLKFTQTDVPNEHYKSISSGWKEHYWNKMKKMLER